MPAKLKRLFRQIAGKELFPSKYVKYLGIYIDPNFNWNYHTETDPDYISTYYYQYTSRDILWNIFIIANIQFSNMSADSK